MSYVRRVLAALDANRASISAILTALILVAPQLHLTSQSVGAWGALIGALITIGFAVADSLAPPAPIASTVHTTTTTKSDSPVVAGTTTTTTETVIPHPNGPPPLAPPPVAPVVSGGGSGS